MAPPLHLAIDLGAGSGRAVVGRVATDGIVVREVHRFQYEPRSVGGRLRWDMARITTGLRVAVTRAAAEATALGEPLVSLGIDAWGVDYGLIDQNGGLVEDPICYRDGRSALVMDDVFARVPREELFGRSGIQVLPINTLFQLAAQVREGLPPGAAHLLMMPDLCHHLLCGSTVTELTNASTTQLLAADRSGWDDELFERLALPRRLMPEIVPAGSTLGVLSPVWEEMTGAGELQVLAPATHDTGSAVAGTPLRPGWAYISSGTWSLVGVEIARPLVDAQVGRANFTNEAGVFGTTRFLKNIMGLWILESCRREWDRAGHVVPYDELLENAARLPAAAGCIYPDDPRFFNPPGMIEAIRDALTVQGRRAPDDPAPLARVVLDSLALRYASVIRTIETLTGHPIPGIHIVGGGSRNRYLNQATADASGRPVLAGPVEATAIGNLAVQAIANGQLDSLEEAREVLAAHLPLERFEPADPQRWEAARREYEAVERSVASTEAGRR